MKAILVVALSLSMSALAQSTPAEPLPRQLDTSSRLALPEVQASRRPDSSQLPAPAASRAVVGTETAAPGNAASIPRK